MPNFWDPCDSETRSKHVMCPTSRLAFQLVARRPIIYYDQQSFKTGHYFHVFLPEEPTWGKEEGELPD
jgi:hypothetical protein